jgi:TatD DNase family protein
MKLLDVHCHLEGERFAKDLDDVLQRAHRAGVQFAFSSGVNPETNRKVLQLSKKYSMIKACFGLYPIDAVVSKFPNVQDDDMRKIESFDYKEELQWIEKNFCFCVAIGEVGLDFKIIKELKNAEEIKEEQKKVFEEIILLAKRLDKPVIIHSRGAELECIELLEKHKMKKVLMHCFGGKKSLIKRIVDNGWFFSVPAVITRLQHFQILVEIVPLGQLLTETDAPYLAPVVGERSEPRDVVTTIKEIAKLKNLEEKDVASQIWKNAEKLFGL